MNERREEFALVAISKLFNSIVLSCKKCDNGFLRDDKKLSSLKDLVDVSTKKCSCFQMYERCKAYVISGIPREFWSMKDTEINIDKESEKKITTYLKKFQQAHDAGLGILFLGGPEGLAKPNSGVGKTSSSIKLLEKAIEEGHTAHYITMHTYFNYVYRSKSEEGSFYQDLIDEIEDADYLCIDEVGKVNKTEYVYNRFEDMIRRRSSKLLVTFMVTNMNQDELQNFVGLSLMDILRNTMIGVAITGKSFRKKKFVDITRRMEVGV